MSNQGNFWPEGFAAQCFPGVFQWSNVGAHEALEPKNIETALAQTKGTIVADVIAALIFQVDCYQRTVTAQEETIGRMRSATADAA